VVVDDARAPARDHSALAGPLREPGPAYRVRFQRPPGSVPLVELFLGVFAPLLAAGVIAYLFQPGNWPSGGHQGAGRLALQVLACVLALMVTLLGFRNFYVIGRAARKVRDPVPVVPAAGHRIAFLATFVPGSEDIDLLRETVAGMRAQSYADLGRVDVWVLDEGDDPAVHALCRELGANHFTRAGVPRWNAPDGLHARRTKHGNINAFLDHLAEEEAGYDLVAGVDPDHVPHPDFLTRTVGFFRDPEVGYVVAPQTYGNACRNVVAQLAESCQFVFHSLVQRSANLVGCPLFVGTNYVVRMDAVAAIGGVQASITEDALTGLKLNEAGWRGVYTPDELAVGEGPEPWRDFYSQQYRWSRGAMDILWRDRRAILGLPWRQRLHHALALTYYPSVGLAWPIGVLCGVLYIFTGATGLNVDFSMWATLYLDVVASQVVLFLWARRLNVSAQEHPHSSGLAGLMMATMTAPVYAKALVDAVLRRPARFVVTPKGAAARPDGPGVFRHHYGWALATAVPLVFADPLGHTAPALLAWSVLTLAVCLTPPVMSIAHNLRSARADVPARPQPPRPEVPDGDPA
jgi:cellulose synthase/poly-beta-1,6-N-acetylglucosamine synthase-like glycosyltransferase